MLLRVGPLLALVATLLACETAPLVGAACTMPSECRQPLSCRFGRCRTQCVLHRDCPLGATCLLDARGEGTCGVTQDRGCERGLGCSDGLACVDDACVARCSDASDCPNDGVCASVAGTATSVCFDPRVERPDAGPVDSGAPDAGSLDANAPEGDAASDPDAGTPAGPLEVCVGPSGMCALSPGGNVFCWGLGNNGRNGDGTEEDTIFPLAVLGRSGAPLEGIDHLACGSAFGCAHEADSGLVLCWGDGSNGELGIAAMVHLVADVVQTATGDLRVRGGRLSAAGYHACVLDTTTNALTCWGDNSGLIDVSHPARFPMREPLPPQAPVLGMITDVAEIAVAPGGGCVIHGATRTVSCWGENAAGEAGGTPFTVLPDLVGSTPVDLGDDRAYLLAAGWNHRAVLAEDGTLLLWGSNTQGQLGLEGAANTATPIAPRPGTPVFTHVASGGESNTTCGVVSGETGAPPGRVRCWGENRLGQAGLGTTTVRVEPRDDVLVEATGLPLERAERVFVGPGNACAVTLDGQLWCWGENDVGQLGLPIDTTLRRAVRIVLPSE